MQQKIKKNPGRFKIPVPPGPKALKAQFIAARLPQPAETCSKIEDILNDLIQKECAAKVFDQSVGDCAPGIGRPALVDLVVLIDTSGSMGDEAANLSASADAAVQAAAQSCPSDLRVAWFGIEGTWPGTLFTQSYRNYLLGLGFVDADMVGTPGDTEDGAAAIMDISDHYDWRPGAARLIFYLGDEALEGGDPQDAADVAAADSAIFTANNAPGGSVTVFTYLGTPIGPLNPATEAEYIRVATDTGGQFFSGAIGGFQAVLERIICTGSTGEICKTVEVPKIAPCIHLRWGEGADDHIETDDWEVLCVTVCNPYSNVTLKNFMLHLVLADADGTAVANLPDGTPSVFVKPRFMICYGDIPPCNPDQERHESCVSRETVLISRGALEGRYTLFVIYCFEACFAYGEALPAFTIELVKS